MVNGRGSYYIVYEKPKDRPNAGYVVLLDEPNRHLNWAVRSYCGYDRTGITLYQHRTFCGEAHNFTEPVSHLDKHFREDHPKSLIVTSKAWAVYTGEDGKGESIPASHLSLLKEA